MQKRKKSSIERFIALPDANKRRQLAEIEAETPEHRLARSRPLNAAERARWRKFKVKTRPGRPRIGTGSGTVNVTVSIEREIRHRSATCNRSGAQSRHSLFLADRPVGRYDPV